MALILVFLLFWSEGFEKDVKFQPSTPNSCQINYIKMDETGRKGIVHLAGNPDKRGLCSAWFYVDGLPEKGRDNLRIFLRGNGKRIKIRVYLREKLNIYREVKGVFKTTGTWQVVSLSLSDSKPVWSSNFPQALTPDKNPDLFIFIENDEPGPFDVLIDQIKVGEENGE
jgi:hypothetical protein